MLLSYNRHYLTFCSLRWSTLRDQDKLAAGEPCVSSREVAPVVAVVVPNVNDDADKMVTRFAYTLGLAAVPTFVAESSKNSRLPWSNDGVYGDDDDNDDEETMDTSAALCEPDAPRNVFAVVCRDARPTGSLTNSW